VECYTPYLAAHTEDPAPIGLLNNSLRVTVRLAVKDRVNVNDEAYSAHKCVDIVRVMDVVIHLTSTTIKFWMKL
jgi:hypothetical protein